MNVNDRIALEIGRAKLAQIVAEAQRDELIAAAQEAAQEEAPSPDRKTEPRPL